MPWSEGSFLVETKPQAEYTSLYVSCLENDARDIVRIIQNGIDLICSDEIGDDDGNVADDKPPTTVTDMVLDQLSGLQLSSESQKNETRKVDVTNSASGAYTTLQQQKPPPRSIAATLQKTDAKGEQALPEVVDGKQQQQQTPGEKVGCYETERIEEAPATMTVSQKSSQQKNNEVVAVVPLQNSSNHENDNDDDDGRHSGPTCSNRPQQDCYSNPPLCALIKGVKMDPSSVKNFSWTEDQSTFSCKLKMDLFDEEIGEKRSWQEAVRNTQISSAGLEKYYDYLNKCDVVLKCSKCDQILHRNCELKELKFYKLPSCEFNEIVDELYCHQHHYGAFDNNIKYSYFVNGPKTDQCFIGSSYLLLNAEVTENCLLLADSNLVVCKNCRQNVGCVDISPSSRYFPRKSCFRFYHITTSLLGKMRDAPADAKEKHFFEMRYPTKEQYFSWLMLSELEYNGTLYYVIRSLDDRPKLMLWILDTFTILTIGKLLDVDSMQKDDGRYVPFPAVKFLYRKLTESDMSDPFVSGHQIGVVDIRLPSDACDLLYNLLEASCAEMPFVCRSLSKFKVGFLPTADEI